MAQCAIGTFETEDCVGLGSWNVVFCQNDKNETQSRVGMISINTYAVDRNECSVKCSLQQRGQETLNSRLNLKFVQKIKIF